MRWNRLGLMFGLAGALMSGRTIALAENSLLADAQSVTHLNPGGHYSWRDLQTLLVLTTNGEVLQIDRRTHRRKLIQHFDPQFVAPTGIKIEPSSRPGWLPPGAKIVAYDADVYDPLSGREVWIVAWPVRGTAAKPEHARLGRRKEAEARYGVWITGAYGKQPHLLGVAPLSRQEFEALTQFDWKRDYNDLFLPGGKEVCFVYRGVIYVMPISGKPAKV